MRWAGAALRGPGWGWGSGAWRVSWIVCTWGGRAEGARAAALARGAPAVADQRPELRGRGSAEASRAGRRRAVASARARAQQPRCDDDDDDDGGHDGHDDHGHTTTTKAPALLLATRCGAPSPRRLRAARACEPPASAAGESCCVARTPPRDNSRAARARARLCAAWRTAARQHTGPALRLSSASRSVTVMFLHGPSHEWHAPAPPCPRRLRHLHLPSRPPSRSPPCRAVPRRAAPAAPGSVSRAFLRPLALRPSHCSPARAGTPTPT